MNNLLLHYAGHDQRPVFFDIDDTLYSTSEFAAQARRNAVDAMIQYGLRMDRDEVLREFREVVTM